MAINHSENNGYFPFRKVWIFSILKIMEKSHSAGMNGYILEKIEKLQSVLGLISM